MNKIMRSPNYTVRRLPLPATNEDQTITRIKNCIEWVRKNLKTTMAIGLGIIELGAALLWLCYDKNN